VSIDPSAEIHADARVHGSATVWAQTMVREGASIGPETSIGRQSYVGPGVTIGRACKLQNHVLIYEPAVIEDAVFIGPGVVFTNDRFPRATTADGSPKSSHDWTPVGVTVRRGASIGARATCVAPVEIGEWAMVAAGSVVTKPVAPFELVGGVPARHLGWVGTSGVPLVPAGSGRYLDESTGETYREVDGRLTGDAPDFSA
jgi:UDP-2-acetamido-3-amino-2,3-dideoxy-glucuronate N-acetyltransferase